MILLHLFSHSLPHPLLRPYKAYTLESKSPGRWHEVSACRLFPVVQFFAGGSTDWNARISSTGQIPPHAPSPPQFKAPTAQPKRADS